MNPIIKVKVSRGGRYGRPVRSWGFRCPRCGVIKTGSSYYLNRPSRKVAKDALHNHMKKEHAGPR